MIASLFGAMNALFQILKPEKLLDARWPSQTRAVSSSLRQKRGLSAEDAEGTQITDEHRGIGRVNDDRHSSDRDLPSCTSCPPCGSFFRTTRKTIQNEAGFRIHKEDRRYRREE